MEMQNDEHDNVGRSILRLANVCWIYIYIYKGVPF